MSAHAQTASATSTIQQMPDVVTLSNPERVQAKAPKNSTEVAVFFSYTCSHCGFFSPKLSTWEKQQDSSVRIIYLPVSWNSSMIAPQRLFFTLQKLNRLDLHQRVFADLKDDSDHLSNTSSVLRWAVAQGIPEQEWLDAYTSQEVTQNALQAQEAFQRFERSGTPSIVVNGRYVLIQSPNVLKTLDKVIQLEKAHR